MVSVRFEKNLVMRLSELVDEKYAAKTALEASMIEYNEINEITKASEMIRDVILCQMAELRVPCDKAETMTAEKHWPFPTYEKLLFSVK